MSAGWPYLTFPMYVLLPDGDVTANDEEYQDEENDDDDQQIVVAHGFLHSLTPV